MKKTRLSLITLALTATLAFSACNDDSADQKDEPKADSSSSTTDNTPSDSADTEESDTTDDTDTDTDTGPAADVEQLATEYCGFIEDMKNAGSDQAKLQKVMEDLGDWAETNATTNADTDEFAQAVKDECGVDPNDPSTFTN